MGGYYKYTTNYLSPLPISWGNVSAETKIQNAITKITNAYHIENRTERFPDAYLEEYDGELGYIDYEWQTTRRPVESNIQQLADQRFAVTAGNTDVITHQLIDKGGREEKKLRAQYVHAAVDGRTVKSGDQTTIPIPTRREGVKQLIELLETDRKTVEDVDIEDLEAEIDRAVYDLFELTEEERVIIEEYLEVF